MQNLQLSQESQKQLYETLKHIHGPDFRLADASEFEDKNKNVGKQYLLQRSNLVIKSITNYSSVQDEQKNHEQLTRSFAVSKLNSYNFHTPHCIEALTYTQGHMGEALELLFYKYYGVEKLPKNEFVKGLNSNDLIQSRRDEKEALESIYGESFEEKIKDLIWVVKIKLDYLVKSDDQKNIKSKPRVPLKDICRLYLAGKCRFGLKCRFLHQQPEPEEKPITKKDSLFTLEIRFPKDCKYPYEPPYFFFYKCDGMFPSLECLRIARRLHNEALPLCEEGTPSIFSVISLLENEDEIKCYLQENKEYFLDENDPLFPTIEITEDGPSHNKKGLTNNKNRKNITTEDIIKQDNEIVEKFMQKQKNSRYLKMKDARRKLPAWNKMSEVIEIVHENQVTIISGETGCGKSTQVPQFILDDWIINRTEEGKEHVEIICTQPRRISAIGVAERVAAERDEKVGITVGYQIRLENKISMNTRLTFCTTGILLQRLSGDPELKTVTHIVVDEVHERSAESDFLLMLLRKLITQRPDLKVILMSATLKSDIFSNYFGQVPVLDIPGRTFPVEQLFLEDILEFSGYVLEEQSQYVSRKVRNNDWQQFQEDLMTAEIKNLEPPKESILDENLTLHQIVNRYTDYSELTCKNIYIMDHGKINFELIEKALEWIVNGDHDYPRTGSILIFLPGMAEILTLKSSLLSNTIFSEKEGNFIVIPLHSALSSEEQSLVFKKPRQGVRKIILSTNIAETSITIDDCIFVIDTGRMKETQFNSNQNMETLEECWVSRANALQRKGRAGRVMSGVCIHLYTSYRYNTFLAQPIPEILRIALEPLLLRIKILHKGRDVDHCRTLADMLEPPSLENISMAVKRLQDVGAFDPLCALTPLGHHLAALPVDVRIGKLIIFGAIFCCVDSALTIAACLSHKSPFVSAPGKRKELHAKKKEFALDNSDQLATLRAYKKWTEVNARGYQAGLTFANENFLSVRTLQTLADIKHQLLDLLISIGFIPVDAKKRPMGQDRVSQFTGFELNANNDNYRLLQGLLCAALYPNVVKVFSPELSFRKQACGAVPKAPKPEELKFRTKDTGSLRIHPISVNVDVASYSSPFLVFQEKIKTRSIFVKEVTMVSPLALTLFSGYGIDIELRDGSFILSLEEGWIMFTVESHRIAQLLQHARVELAKLLQQKMEEPLLNLTNHPQGKKIISTIIHVITNG